MTAALLSWLCEGSAIAAGALVLTRILPRANAATRYAIWCLALGAIGAMGAVSSFAPAGPVGLPTVAPPVVVPSSPQTLIAVLFGIWAGGVLLRLARLIPEIHAVNRLRDRCTAFPEDVESQLPLWLGARGQGRRTRLAVCDDVPGAAVLGFFDPQIVFPNTLLTALTSDELDQIILHEHAHVQRRDDWARLAQELVHAVLWMHPAAAFAARQVNREREIACDESVVARTGVPKAYARCLTRAAEMTSRCAETFNSSPVLGPTLFQRQKELRRRVECLLAVRGRTSGQMSRTAALSGAVVLIALAVQVHAVRLFEEVGEIVLPAVAVMRARVEGVRLLPDAVVRLKPDTTYFDATYFAISDAVVRLKPDPTSEPDPTSKPDPTSEQDITDIAASEREPVLAARSFAAQRSGTPALEPRSAIAHETTPWQKAADAGVGLGETFTRAGISLARRF